LQLSQIWRFFFGLSGQKLQYFPDSFWISDYLYEDLIFLSFPYSIHLFEYPSMISYMHIDSSEGMVMCHPGNESQDQLLPPLLLHQQQGCSIKEFVSFDHPYLHF
jgi:hypothetical protein